MTNPGDDWTACGPQEITKLAGRLRARRQLRWATRAAFATAATAVGVALVVWSLPRPDEGPDYAGISCQRVGELAEAFSNGELPPDLQDQVRRHVALCPICSEKMDALTAMFPRHDIPGGTARRASLALVERGSSP